MRLFEHSTYEAESLVLDLLRSLIRLVNALTKYIEERTLGQ